MLWIFPVAGLVFLTIYLLMANPFRHTPPIRQAPLADALPDYLQTLAARPIRRSPVHLRTHPHMQRKLESSLRFLNQLPREELLPAAQWLNDHGRMLQEEAAALRQSLKKAPALPAFQDGESRIGCFARLFFAHNNAEVTAHRLSQAVEAWQQEVPFTVRELEALLPALKNALMTLLCDLAGQCADEQHILAAADETVAQLENQQEKKAAKLFEQHRHHRLYLSRLTACVRKAPEGDAALWMRQLPLIFSESDEQLTEEERLHQSEAVRWVSNAISSLQQLDHLPWKQLLESWSQCHRLFLQDATYAAMDAESRNRYRQLAGEIARFGFLSERMVCEAALNLASGYPAEDIRSHTGFYLLDEGLPALFQALRLKSSIRLRFRLGMNVTKPWRYLCIGLFVMVLLLLILLGSSPLLWLPAAILLSVGLARLFRPLLQRWMLPPFTPRMALDALPEEAQTLVVCPVMLNDANHALQAVRHLSILQKANPDPHLHFMLLGDFRDSIAGSLANDEEIVSTAAAAIRALKNDTGHPFFYFQRERIYHLPDHVHMCRERKRGGLETLMKLMGGQDIEDTFAYASIQPEKLAGQYHYLITLDNDTLLPPGAALLLVGAMLHPLQRRTVLGDHLRGISILQPQIRTALHMAQTPLARLLAASDRRDDLEPLSVQTHDLGNGIIDPKALLKATSGQFIPGTVLFPELLEGLLGGCTHTGDIALYASKPETLSRWLSQQHRHIRGAWQLLPYVLRLPGIQPERNALLRGDKRRIWLMLGETLLKPLQLLTLFLCVLLHEPLLLLLCLLALDLPLLKSNVSNAVMFLVKLSILPAEAIFRIDAIARTLYRLLFSHQKLLEWAPAAELTHTPAKPDMRFFYMNMAAAGSLALLCILPGALRFPGIGLAAFWTAAPFWLPSLEKSMEPAIKPTGYMREVLLRLAQSTLLFFETAITPDDHGLPPDNVQIDPNKGIDHRTSPADIGLYLCGLISAQKLELLTADELAQRIRPVVDALEQMDKWNGHLYRWYDTRSLAPLKPKWVSTEDSGLLAVCLTTAAQGLRCLLPLLPEYDHDLPQRLDEIACSIQFAPLYDSDADLFFSGYDAENQIPTEGHNNLLASEGRLSSFYAVMTGQVPMQHWFRLGRTRVHTRHGQTLLANSGGLSEYLLAFLFQPPTNGTLLTEMARNAYRLQSSHTLEGVCGVSESSYYAFDPNLHYLSKPFGLSRLALDAQVESSVIAPYATLLALTLEPKAAFANLLRMESLGLEGPLGLFEAADFDPVRIGDGQPMRLIHSHLAHHQGMILCAICNFLLHNELATLFFHLPGTQAFRLLLEEPMIHLPGVLRKPLRRLSKAEKPPCMFAAHPVPSLQFPIHAHVLHGSGTTLVVDAQGGGYLRRNGTMLTRFHSSCHLPSGLRLYLKDSQSGQFWQATEPSAEAVFESAQAVFHLMMGDIASHLRIFVDPLSGMAVYALTVENTSPNQRMLEVCSYLEPSLLPWQFSDGDCETPALETAKLGNYGISARKWADDTDSEENQLWHILTTDTPFSVFHIQTDRCAFLGRGRTLYAPREMEMPLSSLADAVGCMIDPCLSLRGQFVLQPASKARFVFVTGCPRLTESPSAFLLRCDPPDSVLGWYDAALTQALVTAQTLDLSPEEQGLLAPICGLMTYTGQPSQSRYAQTNQLPLQALQSIGLHGESPILFLEYHDHASLSDAVLILKIHAHCHMSGLWFDLVLTCCEDAKPALFRSLEEIAKRSHSHDLMGQQGGIHLLDPASLAPEHRRLLMAGAQLALRTSEGSIREQLASVVMPAQTRALYRQKGGNAWKIALPATGELLLSNGYGGFTQEEGNYVITLPPGRQTPAPWCNPLCNEHFGTLACESGLLFSYAGNCGTGHLTRWPADTITPAGEENFFLRDEGQRLLWSLTRQPLGMGLAVRITHAPGETIYESSGYGVYSRMHCFTDPHAAMGIRVIHLKNEDTVDRILTFCHSLILTCGSHPQAAQLTHTSRLSGGLCMDHPQMEGVVGLCAVDPEASILTTLSAGAFHGLWGIAPTALSGAELPSSADGNTAMLCMTVQLKPCESKTITCALAKAAKRSELAKMFQKLRLSGASKRLHQCKQAWEHRLSGMLYDLPDTGLSLLVNRWLPYQVQAARLMMHGGFYQPMGAVNIRESLQDMLCLLNTDPAQVRSHLLRCAARQFTEGDVQHWWYPDGSGIRTRISDDRLYLPYLTALYVRTTGDQAILDTQIPWLQGDVLNEEDEQRFFTPETTQHTAALREHCLRAIHCTEQGIHGLPLTQGGESVWLGMFLCEVLRLFAPLCDAATAKALQEQRHKLLRLMDRHAWDGNWYLRGWNSAGKPIGTKDADECRIDLLPQSWGVLCGVSRDRCQSAMENVWRMLYQRDTGILQLITPPCETKTANGLLPGLQENGGQYTPAVPWAIAALHQLGQDDRAWELTLNLLPTRHAATQQLARRYRVEPYVLPDYVYSNPQQRGRGSHTWYTSSAALLIAVLTEQLLGFQKTGDQLRFRPVLPKGWDEVHLRYRYGSATYHLHANRECLSAVADGQPLVNGVLLLRDDGRIHEATFPIR